ncbi:hypothetical protein PoB_005674500 [Plakobranchus ocellatus]|uniref:Uncharacterized protein n=1 Tax=Plakobranchus ocellatus TaxID=259542 RepID=A0AAV4CFJ1_9GAST|nr:hypothetical protein PoB_005674500 [Plakobranchus ocellatus]
MPKKRRRSTFTTPRKVRARQPEIDLDLDQDGDDQDPANLRPADSLFQGLQSWIISDLQDMLHRHNLYVIHLKCAYEFARPNFDSYVIVINEQARPTEEHERRFNVPSSSNDVEHRDTAINTSTNECKRISELHKAYDPLQLPCCRETSLPAITWFPGRALDQ